MVEPEIEPERIHVPFLIQNRTQLKPSHYNCAAEEAGLPLHSIFLNRSKWLILAGLSTGYLMLIHLNDQPSIIYTVIS